jgi:hypothetical protein
MRIAGLFPAILNLSPCYNNGFLKHQEKAIVSPSQLPFTAPALINRIRATIRTLPDYRKGGNNQK